MALCPDIGFREQCWAAWHDPESLLLHHALQRKLRENVGIKFSSSFPFVFHSLLLHHALQRILPGHQPFQ
jgi:hypothetical protein